VQSANEREVEEFYKVDEQAKNFIEDRLDAMWTQQTVTLPLISREAVKKRLTEKILEHNETDRAFIELISSQRL